RQRTRFVFVLHLRHVSSRLRYLITAPSSWCLDASETVLIQMFEFTQPVTVEVSLKTTAQVLLTREVVNLNARNNFQAIARVRVDKSVTHVLLHVQSSVMTHELRIPLTRSNGFLFIQTDKPLYTPHQSVKVRAFSMNQELRPANRTVFLTFKVCHTIQTVGTFPMLFPVCDSRLGLWSIEASYSDDFTTKAKTDFEVREYVLPSFSIAMESELNYISYGNFRRFPFKVSSVFLLQLSLQGEVEVTLDMQAVLSKYDGPRDLNGLAGKYLYIAVLLQEDAGGISQEMEFAYVKFVKSPYTLGLVSTPPFLKPGLPYNIQVLVKDHLGKPVRGVPVRMTEKQLFGDQNQNRDLICNDKSTSQSSGLALFVCSMPSQAVKFETADSSLPAFSQANLELKAEAYFSPNERYLYIDPPLPGNALEVGRYADISVYSATPSYLRIKYLNYLVLSKGKVVKYRTQEFLQNADNRQTLRFLVTESMSPSIRLLVYYSLFGEGTSELVADSVWLDVKDKCVNGLQVGDNLYKPKDSLTLDIMTNQKGLVALSAVDSALFSLRPNYKDPVSMVLRHIEQSDLGCGGGGGKNVADVFRLAGLTFMTNANARPLTSDEACTALVRPKRQLTEQAKRDKGETISAFQSIRGISMEAWKRADCQKAFRACCEFIQQHLDQDQNLILARSELGADFDLAPSLVRSSFPESWLWEAHPVRAGQNEITEPLPDSLTTWEVKAVGMFHNGICVAEPVQVLVTLPVNLDVPLPYQVVRGEQVVLSGSIYNQQGRSISYCVTATAGPALCFLDSQPIEGSDLRSTPCTMKTLLGGRTGKVTFTLMALKPGEHTVTFELRIRRGDGNADTLKKTLRVVPEGVRKEVFSGGRLDPQGVYGTSRRALYLKNKMPLNIVPETAVERELTINGEILDEVLTVIHNPDGLRKLVDLPPGSADVEVDLLQQLTQVYQYLERTASWNLLGDDVQGNAAIVRRNIKQRMISVISFKRADSSYSRWMKREASTWVTAQVVRTLSLVDQVINVNHQSLSESVSWLIVQTQQADGSFRERSFSGANKIMTPGYSAVDQSVYLTSFVLIALRKATLIKDPILNAQFQVNSMRSAANYISQHAPGVKSVHVRAVATYALTLFDPNNKGHPAVLRYWRESEVTADWQRPDETSGLTVATTAYVVLTMLLKGRIPYTKPIIAWLTNDQHYGEAFYSKQDTVLTLEALTEYSKTISRATLDQPIQIHYGKYGELRQVHLTQTMPVSSPIQVMKNDDIYVRTGFGRGVSSLKTVYYETVAPTQSCNFDINVEMSINEVFKGKDLSVCLYKPPPNDVNTESTLTVMKIQLPTGVEAFLEDLRQVSSGPQCLSSNIRLTVVEHDVTVSLCILLFFPVEFENVNSGTEVNLIKKATCKIVDIQVGRHYLVMGASGAKLSTSHGPSYRLHIDSDALVEVLPDSCEDPECTEYMKVLDLFSINMQFSGC
uniref:Anaphylatoxin-like domain-containing protein n=1 Tax=Echeneis naucrates TaxID=173247 RepID=A0A665VZD0_ECHNA